MRPPGRTIRRAGGGGVYKRTLKRTFHTRTSFLLTSLHLEADARMRAIFPMRTFTEPESWRLVTFGQNGGPLPKAGAAGDRAGLPWDPFNPFARYVASASVDGYDWFQRNRGRSGCRDAFGF